MRTARVVLATLLSAGALGAVPAMAADPPVVTVVPEPAGANCEFGGLQVTVTTPQDPPPPTDPPTDPPPPAPDPTVDVYYVCNGAPGEPGEPGEPGPQGDPGLDGTSSDDGGSLSDMPVTDENGTPVACKSKRTARWTLPRRFAGQKKVKVRLDGGRRVSTRVNSRRQVRVNLRGKDCGLHFASARAVSRNPATGRRIRPAERLWFVGPDNTLRAVQL